MVSTIKHLSYLLRSSEAELNTIIDNIDRYYYYFEKPKKKFGNNQEEKGKIRYRKLYPSTGRLKTLQLRLNNFLHSNIKMPDYAYGSIRKRNNIQNALAHRYNKFFLSVDLKHFFLYITHHQVFEMFRSYDFSPTVSHILTKLTTYKGTLPQGAPTSPMIANLVFVKTGQKLETIAQKHKLIFTTYLDDLEFSSRSDFKSLITEILSQIKLDQFYVNYKKVTYKQVLPEITGLFVDHNAQLIVNSIISERAKNNPFTKTYLKRVRSASAKI